MLIKFAGDTKLDGTVIVLEGRAAMQRYLNRQEKQADRNHMKFNRTCKVLERGNTSQ